MARRYQVWSYHYPRGPRSYSTNYKEKAEEAIIAVLDKSNVRALALFRDGPDYWDRILIGVLYISIPLWRPDPEAVAWELSSPAIAVKLGLSPEFIGRVTIKRVEEVNAKSAKRKTHDVASPQVLAGSAA